MDKSKIMDVVRMSLGMNRADELRATGRCWRWPRIIGAKRDKIRKQIVKEELKSLE